MDGLRDLFRIARRAALAAVLCSTASSGLGQPIDGEEDDFDFAEEFARYDVHPPFYELEEGAVDLGEFDAPLEETNPLIQSLGSGTASYYGKRFAGRKTANGERFNPGLLTAAHKTLPFGSLVRVTNPRNGRSVTVRINDRGPFIRGRVIDLSRAAAENIGMIRRGHAQVELELVGR